MSQIEDLLTPIPDAYYSDERAAIMRARVRDYEIDERDVDEVSRTVAALQTQGRTVVFVEVPFPDRFVRLHPRGSDDLATASATIDTISAKLFA